MVFNIFEKYSPQWWFNGDESNGRIRTKKTQKKSKITQHIAKKNKHHAVSSVSYQLSRHSLIQAHLLDVLLFKIPDTHPK